MVVISMCMSCGSSGAHAVHVNNLRLLNHITFACFKTFIYHVESLTLQLRTI